MRAELTRENFPNGWYFLDHAGERLTICARTWHDLGGVRLERGEGPVQIDLSMTCLRVEK